MEISFTGHGLAVMTVLYAPAVTSHLAARRALARILDTMFAGSPELVLTQLVSDRRLDTRRLQHLRTLLGKRLRDGDDTQ